MPGRQPYTVELYLNPHRHEGARPHLFTLVLQDREQEDLHGLETADVHLDLEGSIPDLGMSGRRFRDDFLQGKAGGTGDGLAFGRHLFGLLFGDPAVRQRWERIVDRFSEHQRPLRLELVLPRGAAHAVADIPFELLADERGFLFRRHGWSLVRTLRDLAGKTLVIEPGMRALVAWAHPQVAGEARLPETVFTAHEQAWQEEARHLGLEPAAPLRHASLPQLQSHLEAHGGCPVLSLVAHGRVQGGAVWLHKEGHTDYPKDPGDPVRARDLASALRAGGVQVALLWSCHSGQVDADYGAVAEALIDPDVGDLAAVVASQAALEAAGTGDLIRRLLRSWRNLSERSLERAVGEARLALSEDQLQWAAPVYYARPLARRSVTLAEAVSAEAAALVAEARGRRAVLQHAPRPAEYFRGREDEMARAGTLLRHGRLVTLVGLPGMGKTALARRVAEQVLADEQLGLECGWWISLDGVNDVASLRAELASAAGGNPDDVKRDEDLGRTIGARRVLVVLDNAEDLIDAALEHFQRLCETLLRRCPGVRLLFTSRRGLGDLESEREEALPLGRLEPPHDMEAFVAAAGAWLEPEDRAGPALERLVAALDGHPLSLVLVAGQVGQGLSLETLAERILRGMAEEVVAPEYLGRELGEGEDALRRTKRLVSSLNLSFRPLAEREPAAAEMFVWLGHLPAGLPEVLLPYVWGKEAELSLATLLRHHLMERRGRRVGLPAPLRWYATGTVGGTVGEERRRVLLVRTWQALTGWLQALCEGLGKEGARAACEQAAEELANVAALLGHVPEAAQGEEAIALAEAVAGALQGLVPLLSYGGRAGLAVAVVTHAIGVLKRLGFPGPMASGWEELGDLQVRTAQLKEAEASYKEALPIYRAIEARLGEANTLLALGDLQVRTDQLKEAEASYKEALPIYRAIEVRLGEANTLQALGDLQVHTKQLKEAEASYKEALPIFHAIENRLGEANTFQGLGTLALMSREASTAFAQFLQSLEAHHAMDNALGMAGGHGYLARAALAGGRPVRAVVLAGHARELLESTDSHFDQMLVLDDLARALTALDHMPGTVAALYLAWSVARSIDDPSVPQRAARLSQLLEPFDPAAPPSSERLSEAHEILTAAIAACQAQLAASGEDPYSPLG